MARSRRWLGYAAGGSKRHCGRYLHCSRNLTSHRESHNQDIISLCNPFMFPVTVTRTLDSIGSAIGYAELKSRLDPNTEFVPVRLGDLNPQTRWVLERAQADEPEYLPHIRLRAVDLMATEFLCVRESDAIREAGVAIDSADYDLVPVIDPEGKLAGVITTRALARRYVRESEHSTTDTLAAPCRELMEEAEVAGDR